MNSYFKFPNTDVYTYYLDRCCDDLKDNNTYPIPNSFNDPMSSLEDYAKNTNYHKLKKIYLVSPLLAGIGLLI